ncbi:MAG TPA: hypothetical protein VGH64_06090 [Puia sp.]|jgi:hypothetical protein
MKPAIICFVCVLLFIQNSKSQDSLKSEPSGAHEAILAKLTLPGNQSVSIHIMDIKDSSIYVHQKTSGKPDPFHKVNFYDKSGWDVYNYRFIETVKVRNKKLRSWLLPVSIVGGMVAGALIGIAATKNHGDFEGSANQVFAGAIGALVGGGAGMVTGFVICGASEKKYLINGDWKSFEEMKKSMNY